MALVGTGNEKVDELLNGGFSKGAKVAVVGATGLGKSILLTTIAKNGMAQDNHPGIIIDTDNATIGSQNHLSYAKTFLDWKLTRWSNSTRKTKDARENAAYQHVKNIQQPTRHFDESRIDDDFLAYHLPRTSRVIFDGFAPQTSAEKFKKIISSIQKMETLYLNRRTRGQAPYLKSEEYWDQMIKENGKSYLSRAKVKELAFVIGNASHEEVKTYERELRSLVNGSGYEKKLENFLQIGRDISFGHLSRIKFYQKGANPETDFEAADDMLPKGRIKPNLARLNIDTNYSFFFGLTSNERSIFDLVNNPIPTNSPLHYVDAVIAMGIVPVSQNSITPIKAMAILKNRGNSYNPMVHSYEIGENGIKDIYRLDLSTQVKMKKAI